MDWRFLRRYKLPKQSEKNKRFTYDKLYMTEWNTSNIIALISSIIAILALIFSFYFNRKTLKQSERNLKIQLLHYDKNNALSNLYRYFRKDKKIDYEKFKQQIENYLESFQGQFIPDDIVRLIEDSFNRLDEKFRNYYPQEDFSEEQLREYLESEQDYVGKMSPEDRFNYEAKKEFDSLRNIIKRRLVKEIKRKIKNPLRQ